MPWPRFRPPSQTLIGVRPAPAIAPSAGAQDAATAESRTPEILFGGMLVVTLGGMLWLNASNRRYYAEHDEAHRRRFGSV